MPLDFLKKDDSNEETLVEDEFVELDAEMTEEDQKVVIRAVTLKEFGDTEKVQKHLRNNHIVWINIGPLKSKDMTDLKRSVKRLKKTVKSIDGDMAGVDEEWIIACPSYAKISRTGDHVESEEE